MLKTKLLFQKKHLQFYFLYDSIIHGSLVKRLRRRPLTAETRVRFPYGLLKHLHLMQVLFCCLNILSYLSHKPNCKLESAASLLSVALQLQEREPKHNSGSLSYFLHISCSQINPHIHLDCSSAISMNLHTFL